jgi:hypothetical protein
MIPSLIFKIIQQRINIFILLFLECEFSLTRQVVFILMTQSIKSNLEKHKTIEIKLLTKFECSYAMFMSLSRKGYIYLIFLLAQKYGFRLLRMELMFSLIGGSIVLLKCF